MSGGIAVRTALHAAARQMTFSWMTAVCAPIPIPQRPHASAATGAATLRSEMGAECRGSHTRTVPSSPALASRVPSGDHATARTQPVWPVRVACGAPLAGVPHPHRAVAAGAGQPGPVRRPTPPPPPRRCGRSGSPAVRRSPRPTPAPSCRRRRWPAGSRPATTPPPAPRRCGRQGRLRCAARRVPHPHRAVVAGAGQPGAVRRPRHRPHPAGVTVRVACGGRWPRPTPAPCRRRRRWPAGSRPATTPPPAPSRCGRQGRLRWPLAASHTRTVPSSPALASRARPATTPPPHPAGVAGQDAEQRVGGVVRPHRSCR